MSGIEDSDSEQFEVVIRPVGGVEREHANLLRKRLIHDGFHEEVVSVRSLETGRHQCEDCGERPSEVLSSDSHPKGPNLLICEECKA